MPIYDVLIRSNDLLASAGQDFFEEPPIEGTAITWHDEQWIVDDLDDRYSPPQITLRRGDP